MAEALEQAAPVYRALWWREHDRKNREWIAAIAKLVRQFGKQMAQRIASTYRTQWPKEKTTVEVVLHANWAGAYTTTHDTLITISSVDPSIQGNAALETLFHESSHALIGSMQRQLAARFQALAK